MSISTKLSKEQVTMNKLIENMKKANATRGEALSKWFDLVENNAYHRELNTQSRQYC